MRPLAIGLLAITAVAGGGLLLTDKLGRRPDGSFRLASNQLVKGGALAFRGRGADLALHADGATLAVLAKDRVFLIRNGAILDGSETKLPKAASAAKGALWLDDVRLIVSTTGDKLQLFRREGDKLVHDRDVTLLKEGRKKATPGGLALSDDRTKLYVPLADARVVAELDAATLTELRAFPTLHLPCDVAVKGDLLAVADWGGREKEDGEETAKSGTHDLVVDRDGVMTTGAITLVNLKDGATRHVATGRHPAGLAFGGDRLYVACAADDRIDEVDPVAGRVTRSMPMAFDSRRLFGSMPVELAVTADRIYALGGGDNAVAEIDRKTGKTIAFRAAGFYPAAIVLNGRSAWVLNSKGNGSVQNTVAGKNGNAHDFQGTISTVDLTVDPKVATAEVARLNDWTGGRRKPTSVVYDGRIKHVVYIIKENRTYDEIHGDDPRGNGDPKLCTVGEKVMPNHRKIAREWTLFDNGYVSGTNSADGHSWSTQSIANDYEELMYVGGYPRSYPDEGNDAMGYSSKGFLWNLAERHGKSVRVYGEFMNADVAEFSPRKPKDWFEAWEDYKNGGKVFTYRPKPEVASLERVANKRVHYWPLLQSDQSRADEFIREQEEFRRAKKIPNLSILTLPTDHTEGVDKDYPTPRAMMADNDLALGRVVEYLTKRPEWKHTAIFVIEDDAQSGPDHVDGHRTNYMVLTPYNRGNRVDSGLYTTCNMIRSIELMLGLPPMNRFDALARPIETPFGKTADLTPYLHVKNNIPLDEPNPGRKTAMTATERYWAEKNEELDWSKPDSADFYWLNRIVWQSLRPGVPYPSREGEAPGMVDGD